MNAAEWAEVHAGKKHAMEECRQAGGQFFEYRGITYRADGTSLGCIACRGTTLHYDNCPRAIALRIRQ